MVVPGGMEKMSKKAYTLLVISNRKGETRSLTFSAAWLKAAIAMTCVVAVVFAAGLVDYMGLLLQSLENKKLKTENAILVQQFQVVEGKLDTLEKSIQRVNNFTKKLRLITNIQDTNRALKLSVSTSPNGVLEKYTEGEGSDHGHSHGHSHNSNLRLPASRMGMAKDSLFLKKPPLDTAKGELTIQKGRDYGSLAIRIDRSVLETQLTEQGVFELHGALSERQSLLNATPTIKPVRGWYTSKFGYRLDPFTNKPTMHAGLDIAAPPGSPVYAPAAGVVSYVGFEKGYGRIVSIDHGYGVVTRYAHNSRVFVDVGQRVKMSDVISAVGSTGRSSGPHLHYEIRVQGIAVDPENYILE